MDYSFARTNEGTTDQLKILSMVDVATGFGGSTVVEVKGAGGAAGDYAVQWSLRFLRQLGHTKVTLQTDQEQSIMALANRVADQRQHQTLTRQTPRRSHQSNSSVERYHI